MSKEIVESYYQAIMTRIESEVLAINGLFNHQGIKGTGNENVLLDLLSSFLPKRYGVSTGVIVDRHGNQSRQCDIVIYDALNYPELFSLTSAKFFPVDFVYATIEVKTTLDKTKMKEVVENIRSVQPLNYIKEKFRHTPTEPIEELKSDSVLWETKSTTVPMGFIFGYSTTAKKFKTFVDWFSPSKDDIGPSHVFALDQGFLVDHPKKGLLSFFSPYIKDDCYKNSEAMDVEEKLGKGWVDIDGKSYPISQLAKQKIVINQSKVFLNFVVIVSDLLAKKHLSPNICIYKNYIRENNKTMFIVENDKIKVYR